MQTASTATLALAGVLTLTVSAAAQPSGEATPPSPPAGSPAAPAQSAAPAPAVAPESNTPSDLPAPPSDGNTAPTTSAPTASAPASAQTDANTAPTVSAPADTPAGELAPAPNAQEASKEAPVGAPDNGPATDVPDPTDDAQSLQAQGAGGSTGTLTPSGTATALAGTSSATLPRVEVAQAPIPDAIFAEDWWTHARPIFELHGALRTRAELFHNYSLGRYDLRSVALWPQPADAYLGAQGTASGPRLCTGAEQDTANSSSTDPSRLYACDNETQQTANIRLRLNPEIHISDNVRIHAQVDLFDNLTLGSTPAGYRFASGENGQEVVVRSGYYPIGFYDDTLVSPASSRNSWTDSIAVKRAWGEYSTPVGELRFGRMPNHWGVGMLYNSGDRYDDDYQSTIDRFMFTTGIKPLDLVVAGSWDLPNEGALGSIDMPGAQPYDIAELDDVNQYSLVIMRKKSAELQQQMLTRGDLVLNAGLYFTYRDQTFANDQALPGDQGGATPDADRDELPNQYARRQATAYVPDLWVQVLYKKFRLELEAAAILGSVGSLEVGSGNAQDFERDNSYTLRQFGAVLELEQKLIEDRLNLGFSFGWASGDPDAYNQGNGSTRPGNLVPTSNEVQINDDTISTFRFHPSYRVDLILNRNILQRVQGTYFIRPSASYDFMRDPEGQRAGGAIQAIWTRASEFVQTPGHDADLGIELNASVYFQARDGVLNDNPDKMGGFYSSLQFGVLFPLAGMGYQPGELENLPRGAETSSAINLRLFLGILF
jgi:uncharacterized protein (TIGR04551 family)